MPRVIIPLRIRMKRCWVWGKYLSSKDRGNEGRDPALLIIAGGDMVDGHADRPPFSHARGLPLRLGTRFHKVPNRFIHLSEARGQVLNPLLHRRVCSFLLQPDQPESSIAAETPPSNSTR